MKQLSDARRRPVIHYSEPRTHERPARSTVYWSGGMHLFLVIALWVITAFRPAPVVYETIAITLYSPPPASAEQDVEAPTPPPEEVQIETPEPPPEPDDVPLPQPREETTPPPQPPRETPPEPKPPTEEPRRTERSENPPSQRTGDDLNVRMEGVRRDYPVYYNNILTQIARCFRGSRGEHRAVVKFTILRDGTAVDIEVVESSGSLAFEVRALQAVECAGAGRFGPLPADIAYDELPILFSFDPRG